MTEETWRHRLEAAIKDSGKSWNEISSAAGTAPNYLSLILRGGREPKVTNLLKICDAVPVSVAFVLLGLDVTPEDRELLRLLARNPKARAAILAIIESSGGT